MNALAQSLVSQASRGRMLSDRDLSEFSASDFREAIAALVANDKIGLADALCESGLALHPGDPHILSMAGLMANLHQDWERAEEYLRELIAIQGDAHVTEFTWNLLTRVMRCQCEPLEALSVAKTGLIYHPHSADLQRERSQLQDLLGEVSAFVGPIQQRQ